MEAKSLRRCSMISTKKQRNCPSTTIARWEFSWPQRKSTKNQQCMLSAPPLWSLS
ncbi:hypothetical protein RHGRI_030234 [Rhododendron griersonianum]|uniref:Uncharacterized protein n=1 Tax=Rhododendron griersonianum TaxID=479676 RepID=A0AAV6IM37_9ERIC|nr:hypothetical protein RHGRI_030234 [Rhododendron griersonianum]